MSARYRDKNDRISLKIISEKERNKELSDKASFFEVRDTSTHGSSTRGSISWGGSKTIFEDLTGDTIFEENYGLRSIDHKQKDANEHSKFEEKIRSPPRGGKTVFDDLTGHMIRSGLLDQAVKTLTNTKFVLGRIRDLGISRTVEAHIHDCKLLRKKIQKIHKKKPTSPCSVLIPTSPPSSSSDESSKDPFRICESFSITTDWKNQEKIIARPDESTCASSQSESTFSFQSIDLLDAKRTILTISKKLKKCILHEVDNLELDTYDSDDPNLQILRDTENAFYTLGNFLHDNDWNHEAMTFYRSCLSVRLNKTDLVTTQEDYAILGHALSKIGDIQAIRGKLNKALSAYDVAISKYRVSNDMIEAAKIYNRKGDIHGAQGDLQSALEAYEKAVQLQRKKIGNHHVSLAETLHNIGVVHRHQDNLDAALQAYKEALFILKENGDDNLDIARTLNNIGSIYRRKGEYDKAMEYFVEVLRVRRKIQGDYHASVNLTLIHYAKALRLKGDMREAIKFYDEAMK